MSFSRVTLAVCRRVDLSTTCHSIRACVTFHLCWQDLFFYGANTCRSRALRYKGWPVLFLNSVGKVTGKWNEVCSKKVNQWFPTQVINRSNIVIFSRWTRPKALIKAKKKKSSGFIHYLSACSKHKTRNYTKHTNKEVMCFPAPKLSTLKGANIATSYFMQSSFWAMKWWIYDFFESLDWHSRTATRDKNTTHCLVWQGLTVSICFSSVIRSSTLEYA